MSQPGDYGEHEYEVTASARVYADDDELAYVAGLSRILNEKCEVNVRLIDEGEEETECPS